MAESYRFLRRNGSNFKRDVESNICGEGVPNDGKIKIHPYLTFDFTQVKAYVFV